jgi:hypothetical protein
MGLEPNKNQIRLGPLSGGAILRRLVTLSTPSEIDPRADRKIAEGTPSVERPSTQSSRPDQGRPQPLEGVPA